MPTIRVVDIETTGFTPPEAEVIELGWQDLFFREETPTEVLLSSPVMARLFGSERPCPPEVLAVHHILDPEREGLSLFDKADPGSSWLVGSCEIVAFAAHNANFEQQFLNDGAPLGLLTWLGLPFICTYKCALHVWPDAPSHGNQALRYWLGLDGVDRDAAHPPHRAGPDAYVTAHILSRLLELHTLDQLLQWTREPERLVKWRFGKHKGQRIEDTPADYLDWVVRKSDMEHDIKHGCREELRRRAEVRRNAMLPQTGPAGDMGRFALEMPDLNTRELGLELTGCATANSLDQDP